MKILVDIVHPADVLFFLNPIRVLTSRGHRIVITSRTKDVTTALLDRFALPHTVISVAGTGIAGLARELISRDARLLRIAQRERPDVLTAFGGTAISHVGAALRIPSIGFYDADTSKLQNFLTYPFLTELHVPQSYAGPVPAAKTRRFPGFKELSYLHSNYFRPSRTVAETNGLDPDADNYFVRVVSWGASHDLAKSGWGIELLSRIVAKLAALGSVHISAECDLPDCLARYAYRGNVEEVHHFLAFCRLYVGESVTMAAEAVMLGVPAIAATPFELGVVSRLEQLALMRTVPDSGWGNLETAIDAILARAPDRRPSPEQADELDADVAAYVVAALEKFAHRNRRSVATGEVYRSAR